ncbi:MAG TPA: putative Ig domain-containing protein [Acidimicrobiales bacterium]|nr:putative Ig domain-containing protein [Acidimicrobiales bacterium]
MLWTATSVELWVDGTLEVTATDANCSANVPSDGMDSGTEPCIPTGTGMYFSMQQSSLDGTTIPTDPSDLAWESGFHVTNGNTVNVTNPGTQTGSVGTSASLQIPASDSAGGQTLTYSATGLPAGLSINASTGLISGTPTLPGTSSVTVSATDTTGASGSASFGWTVNSAANTVTVTNPGSQTGTVGTSASLQIHASDSASGQTLTYGATGLPAGLSINASTGLISGTPTSPGTSSVTVSATDTTGASGSASFGWTVNSAANTVTVTNPGSQTGTVGTSASLQIHASDSASGQTLTYGATGLPAGLSINASTGLISGMPTIATSYSVTVKAKDATGASGSATFSWVISASGGGIVNGGFETGTLSGWTPSGPKTGVTTYRPHSGTYAAVLGSTSPTNGSSSITQTFVAPSGTSTLHVWYNLTCPGSLSREWATATLKDNTTSTTKVLMKVCVQSSGWVQVTASVNPGQSYTLTLTSHDDNRAGDPTHTRYDDVSLS